jgi:hypothetical protein
MGLLACGGLLGCGGKGKARLEGTWRGQKAEGADIQASASDFAKQTTLEFKADQLTIRLPSGSVASKYAIKKEDGNALTLTTEKDGADDPQVFTFVDPKTLKWAPLPGTTLVFAKQ